MRERESRVWKEKKENDGDWEAISGKYDREFNFKREELELRRREIEMKEKEERQWEVTIREIEMKEKEKERQWGIRKENLRI